MSRLMKIAFAVVVFQVVLALPAFANPGCNNGKFVGSYTRATVFPDIWGDGTAIQHTLILQLNLNSDGTVFELFTGLPDIMLSSGSGTPSVGSWKCQKDGKLVVTVINSTYVPTNDAAFHGVPNVPTDLILLSHSRNTLLLTVTDDNTLTRTQVRSRRYTPAQDPTDPNGGTLGAINNTVVTYKRLVASDADLLAP